MTSMVRVMRMFIAVGVLTILAEPHIPIGDARYAFAVLGLIAACVVGRKPRA